MVALRLSRTTLHQVMAGLAETLQRFPLPLGVMLLAALQGICLSHDWHPWGSEVEAGRRFAFLALAFFVLLACQLVTESRAWSRLVLAALSTIGLALLALRVFTLPADSWVLFKGPLLFLAPCVVLLVTFAPVLRGDLGNVPFWNFNRAGWLGAALGLLAAVILAAGISSGFYAIETLFDLSIPGELFFDVWMLCFTLLWPWLALSNLPRRFDTESCEVPWGLRVLSLYILLPLVFVYLFILYGYIGKVAYQWQLPKGQVATLVSIYATVGVLVYLVDYPFRRKGEFAARLFGRAFFPALFLPLGMLVIALWHRISEYGFTEARYAVGLFGLWLLICTVYTSLRLRPQLKILPLVLAVFLAFACFGPWGAVGVSTRSQMTRLASLLRDNGMLVEGRIQRAGETMPFDATKSISSIVTYLIDTGRRDALAPWFKDSGIELASTTNGAQVLGALGLDYVSEWQDKPNFSFNVSRDQVFRVGGYEVLAQIRLAAGRTHTLVALDGSRFYSLQLNKRGQSVTVTTPTGQEIRLPLVPAIEKLREGEHTEYQKTRILTFQASEQNLRVRLYLESLSGVIEPDGPRVTAAEGILLVGSGPEQ